MKVIFLINKAETPSSRIRVINLMEELNKSGLNATYVVLESNRLKRLAQFRRCDSYDVVVLQKKMLHSLELRVLRHFSRKLVYDFDDAIYYKAGSCSTDPKAHNSAKRERRFASIIKRCDAVIAANEILQNKVESLRSDLPVYVIPSAVEVDGFSIKNNFSLSGTPVIGWVGTAKTQRYLQFILPALQKVNSKVPFKLNVISNEKPELEGIEVEFTQWDVKGQYEALVKCDVAIMPLSLDPFSEGKSAYKLLQYMSCGVPSVCSAVGMNIDVSSSDEFCFCANDCDEFAEKLIKLIRDESIRRLYGTKGRKLIVDFYSIEAVGKQLADVLGRIEQANDF